PARGQKATRKKLCTALAPLQGGQALFARDCCLPSERLDPRYAFGPTGNFWRRCTTMSPYSFLGERNDRSRPRLEDQAALDPGPDRAQSQWQAACDHARAGEDRDDLAQQRGR